MNRPLSGDQLAALEQEFPVTEAPPAKLTRAEKLNRLAALVERAQHPIYIFDRIEQRDDFVLGRMYHPYSVFGIAIRSEEFKADGLKADIAPGTPNADLSVLGGMKYFELERDDLHAISCNCGGNLASTEMASRLRTMAGGGGPIRQFIRGALSW